MRHSLFYYYFLILFLFAALYCRDLKKYLPVHVFFFFCISSCTRIARLIILSFIITERVGQLNSSYKISQEEAG